MFFPREPSGPEPPRIPESNDAGLGLGLVVLAALIVGWFGFWWGIAIFVVGFVLVAFIDGLNLATADAERPAPSRPPVLAKVHASASELVASILCYGIAAVAGLASSHGVGGIAGAAAAYTVLGAGVDWLMDSDWTGALGSWCLLGAAWFALSAPLAAYVAPGYAVEGVGSNVAVVVLMIGAGWLVTLASPWRHRWSGQVHG